MKELIPVTLILLFLWQCTSSPKASLTTEIKPDSGYDSLLAREVGADPYGMRKYVMAFLKKGPNRETDSVRAAELQRAHLDNIAKLAEEGKLVVAGPFFGNEELRGIYIFAVESVEEAEALTQTDPALQSGSLVMELKPWYGSAALMKINELHRKVSREKI